MARLAQVLRNANPKLLRFAVRKRNRCERCGRARAVLRKFRLCRICFRNLASNGDLPGVVKASW